MQTEPPVAQLLQFTFSCLFCSYPQPDREAGKCKLQSDPSTGFSKSLAPDFAPENARVGLHKPAGILTPGDSRCRLPGFWHLLHGEDARGLMNGLDTSLWAQTYNNGATIHPEQPGLELGNLGSVSNCPVLIIWAVIQNLLLGCSTRQKDISKAAVTNLVPPN